MHVTAQKNRSTFDQKERRTPFQRTTLDAQTNDRDHDIPAIQDVHPMEVDMIELITNPSAMAKAAGCCLRQLKSDSSGVTAIEYGLIAGAIAVAIIATVVALGADINNMFTAVGSALNSAGGTN